jgi:outer membrane protein assembly factor BamB
MCCRRLILGVVAASCVFVVDVAQSRCDETREDRVATAVPDAPQPRHPVERIADHPVPHEEADRPWASPPPLASAAALQGHDWPQWRGPNRDGVWRETGILEKFPPHGLHVRWRAKVGSGYSGVVVAKARVYVTDRRLRPDVERVLCFAEQTGEPLWVHSYPCDYENMEYGSGPRAAPTVHDGKVYTFGARGHLFCLDAANGKTLWKKDLVKDHQARLPRWGASAAPLVEDELLIVVAGGQPGACVMAFHKDTGEVMWKALDDRPAYSSPIAVDAGGQRQVIVWTCDTVSSLAPATGKVYWQVPYRNANDHHVVATPVVRNGLLLVNSVWRKTAKMLKLNSGKPAASVLWETKRWEAHNLYSTAIFPDERHFYLVDHTDVCCIDASNGKEIWRAPALAHHSGSRGTVGLAGAHLTANGRQVFIFDDQGKLILARLSPDGYAEVGRTFLIEATSGTHWQSPLTWAHPAYANRHVFARNDKELVCASLAADQPVAAHPAEVNSILLRARKTIPAKFVWAPVVFSPDGTMLAVSEFKKIRLWDVNKSKERMVLGGHRNTVYCVAFSSDGKRLAAVGGHGNLKRAEAKIWDLETGHEVASMQGHTGRIMGVDFAPDGSTVVTGSDDATVRLWDAATGKERIVFKGHRDAVSSVAFAADGVTVASASWDGTIRLWDTATGKARATLQGHEDEVLAVAFSQDGKLLASAGGDRTVRLWDVATTKQRAVLAGHQGTVYCVAFSPDGSLLASGSGDETVKLWDVNTGRLRGTLRDTMSLIKSVAFSPDGKTLVTAKLDDTVKLWELELDK